MKENNGIAAAEQASPPSLFGWLPLLVGLLVGVASYGVLAFFDMQHKRELVERESVRALRHAEIAIENSWDKTKELAGVIARQLHGAAQEKSATVLTPYSVVWPHAGFFLYDRLGEPIPLSIPSQTGSSAGNFSYTARRQIVKSLMGSEAQGFTRMRGFLSLSASAPVQNSHIRTIQVSLPLDGTLLQEIKKQIHADVAIIPLVPESASELEAAENVPSTFSLQTESGKPGPDSSLWPEAGKILKKRKVSALDIFSIEGTGRYFASVPLKGPDGAVAGMLMVAPLQPLTVLPVAWHAGAACLLGLMGTVLAMLALHRRGVNLARHFARALRLFVDREQAGEPVSLSEMGWPRSFDKLFKSITEMLRSYKERAKDAEHRLSGAGNSLSCNVATDTSEDFSRLFSSMPLGAFQTNSEGDFINLNTSFAYQLGYDSPMRLMSEAPSLLSLMEATAGVKSMQSLIDHGNDSRIVFLRRKDGEVRPFNISAYPLTAANGEDSNIIEGFLRGRRANEEAGKLARERDEAKAQRVSLALLLASTCRRIRSFFTTHPGEHLAPDDGDIGGSGSALDDVYQIALAEAENSPPVDVPIPFERFMGELCLRVLPALNARSISLRCEATDDIPSRLSGPAAQLRHAIERALLAVTQSVSGGFAYIGLSKDPNVEPQPGIIPLLCTLSWGWEDASARESLNWSGEAFGAADGSGDAAAVKVLFEAAPVAAENAGPSLDYGLLDMEDELALLDFLVHLMEGPLLGNIFKKDARSIWFTVPVADISAEGIKSRQASAVSSSSQESPTIGAMDEDVTVYSRLPSSGNKAGMLLGDAPVEVAALVAEGDGDIAGVSSGEALSGMSYGIEDERLISASSYEDGLDILFVDPDMDSRIMFSFLLSDTPHRMIEARDGQEGIESYKNGNFDLIFLDMDMPLMDGYQVSRVIRAIEEDEGRKQTNIIAMTPYVSPELRQKCVSSGCSEFLTKPFGKVSLLPLLNAFVKMKKEAAK